MTKIKTSLRDHFVFIGGVNPHDHFFKINNAGILYRDKKYLSTSKFPERTLFEYIVSGKGYIDNVDNGQMHTVSPGDCVVIRSFTNVKYYADPNDPYVKLWFTATGSFAEAMCDIFTKVPVTVTHGSQTAYKAFEKLLKQLEKGEADGFKNAHMFLDIVHAVFSENAQFVVSTEDSHVDVSDFCDRVVSYIDLFYCDGITVEDIAKHFDVSQRYLIEQFKRAYGTTPHKYINQKRMEFARFMLLRTGHTVNAISESLGFCEPGYFTKAFAKHYGMSPKKFRECGGKEQADTQK